MHEINKAISDNWRVLIMV